MKWQNMDNELAQAGEKASQEEAEGTPTEDPGQRVGQDMVKAQAREENGISGLKRSGESGLVRECR